MSEKKLVIQHGESNTRVKFNDYDSLVSNSKRRLNIKGEFRLEYEEDGKWITIVDNDDVEDLSDKSKLRVVMKKDKSASSRGGNNTAIGGAAAYHGNAQYVGGKVSGTMVGGDYRDGDIINAQNFGGKTNNFNSSVKAGVLGDNAKVDTLNN